MLVLAVIVHRLKYAQMEAVLPEHQPPVEDDNVKGDEKKDRRRQHFVKLMLEPMPEPTHIDLLGDGCISRSWLRVLQYVPS